MTSSQGERAYLDLLNDILQHGSSRGDRTGTGTQSVFGRQLRFDISNSVPLLTTKFIKWKNVVHELLWFLRGCTDSKVLEKNGVNIWKPNSSEEFIKSRNLEYEEGDIGPMYGFQWLHWGADYKGCSLSYEYQGINQLDEVVHLLKTDPFSRRIMMSTYNVGDKDKGVLYPCHGLIVQFYVENDGSSNEMHLSCHMYQRSMDTFLGAPYNIFSYSVLVYIIASKCNMKPKDLIISVGDAHLYQDHLEQARCQLSRDPYAPPRLVVCSDVKDKNWNDLCISDFDVVGYKSHPYIKAKMSV